MVLLQVSYQTTRRERSPAPINKRGPRVGSRTREVIPYRSLHHRKEVLLDAAQREVRLDAAQTKVRLDVAQREVRLNSTVRIFA